MAVFAYGRVSTKDQTTENQRMEIERAGFKIDCRTTFQRKDVFFGYKGYHLKLFRIGQSSFYNGSNGSNCADSVRTICR